MRRELEGKSPRPAESPVVISIRITLPRKAMWLVSGFLSGSIATETLVRVLAGLHGG